MRVQFMSDLHLDTNVFLNDEFIISPAPGADCLVLNGDIGDPWEKYYAQLVKQASEKFKYVILVAGNHEYYGHSIEDTHMKMRELAESCGGAAGGVYYLNKDSVVLEGTRFLGCTMWSNVNDFAPIFVSDYRLITISNSNKTKVTSEYIRGLHNDHVAWLESELESDKETPTIIVTHHAPDMRMNGKYLHNQLNSAFATDLPQLFREPLRGWICGHTHQNNTHYTNGIPCMANCLGYEREETGFNPLCCAF